MKKNKLDLTYEVDFELAGIVCNKKEYTLAWHLNAVLYMDFVKQADIKIEFSNQSFVLISNMKHETEFTELILLQNKLISGSTSQLQFLIPELKQYDYLIKLKDETGELTLEYVCSAIREIPLIEYVLELDFDGLKSKENLLY